MKCCWARAETCHSYNPTKGSGGNAGGGPGSGAANTWHWDNVSIAPAVPFTILRADRGAVDAAEADVRFPVASSPGAHLRFLGVGNDLEVSFDAGASWQPAVRQAALKGADEHFKSYWTPIPPGIDHVRIRGVDGWFSPWMARYISLWLPAEP